jgi:N-acetylmuramoyl-L-alanine amidase
MIILDNGHGSDTYGKASPVWSDGTQLFEYEFNRDIAKRIHAGLELLSIKSHILVPEAIDIRLNVRCDRANKIYETIPDSFLISIHGNAAMNPNEGTGWEVWTSPGQTRSDKIATKLQEAAKEFLPGFKMRTDYCDGDPDKESKFYILIHTKCPAVLTENLFFDNERDCRFMMSEMGRNVIARLHIEGIINYLKL